MEKRYHYWNEGGEVQGPVTQIELQNLYGRGVISRATHLCREGETEWHLLSESEFQSAAAPPPAPTTPSSPPPPPTTNPPVKEQESKLHFVLNLIWYVCVFGGSILMALLQFGMAPKTQEIGLRISGALGGFVAYLVMLILIPQLLSRIAPKRFRIWTKLALSAGMGILVILSVLVALGKQVEKVQGEAKAGEYLKPMEDRMKEDVAEAVKANAEAGEVNPTTIKTREELASKQQLAIKLRDLRAGVLNDLQHLDEQMETALSKSDLDEPARLDYIRRYKEGAHYDFLLEEWGSMVKLSDSIVDFYDFLDKNWGRWTVTDGAITWQDQAGLDAYRAGIAEINKRANAINALKNPFAQNTPPAEPK